MNQAPFLHSARISVLACTVLATVPALAGPCTISSGPQRAALLEVFTSEGCSSCPPADRWLSSIVAQCRDAGQVVPLALHVDYWNYLGWKDSFANPAFSTRQREQAAHTLTGVVYTPQVMLNGQDFRGWTDPARFKSAVAEINNLPALANINLGLSTAAEGSIEIDTSIQLLEPGRALVYLAVFENNLTTWVKAGENGGTRLHHDAVVRAWYGPLSVKGKSATSWRQKVTLNPGWKTSDLGVAAFVQQASNGEILQAVATKPCRE